MNSNTDRSQIPEAVADAHQLRRIRGAADSEHLVYLVRLAAFLIIIVAILDKNRRPS